MVQGQQEQDTGPYSDEGGKKCQLAQVLGLVHGGHDQTPDGGSHHDTGGETGQGTLEIAIHLTFEQENTG
jgi:hypothetical protein